MHVHVTDSDCNLDESGACIGCGTIHYDEPCEECGGHGFHKGFCSENADLAHYETTNRHCPNGCTNETSFVNLRDKGAMTQTHVDSIIAKKGRSVLETCNYCGKFTPVWC